MSSNPYTDGQVAWTGENPGMYLKADPAGEWTSLLCFFRITWSPLGRGHALVLLEDPAGQNPTARNLCLTDNEPMARFLVEGFMSHFAAFRGRALLLGLPYRKLDSVHRSGDTRNQYSEHVSGDGLDIELCWGKLGRPYAMDMQPEQSATGRHEMYSLFVDSHDAWCTINGSRLPGQVVPRMVHGKESRSAFLAFSETWIERTAARDPA